jgi:hypothetical protein
MKQDSGTVRLVIWALLIVTETVLIGALALIGVGKSVPGEIIAIPVAAVGAIGAILSRTHTNDPDASQPVTVMNAPSEPVPTTTADSGAVS